MSVKILEIVCTKCGELWVEGHADLCGLVSGWCEPGCRPGRVSVWVDSGPPRVWYDSSVSDAGGGVLVEELIPGVVDEWRRVRMEE